jgi:two-component system, chemotaxis family, CheB/CheR fusion protein
VHAEEQIRVWVPGCSTGEEAYSLAILFHEEFERRGVRRNLIIFASDVDEDALSVARDGVYSGAVSEDISEARLERYFHREDGHYRAVTELRGCIVFAVHSLLRDPPFSRLHLISCRNLLIYLNRDLQEQVMGVFRYACRDEAYLVLGASETAAEDLFQQVDKKHRIYATRPRSDGARAMLPDILAAPMDRATSLARDSRATSKSSPAEIHLAVLEAAAPPSLVVDERGNVLHLSPTASRFLQQGGGTPARRVTELVRPELRDEVHVLVRRAADAPGPQVSSFIPVAFNGGVHRVVMVAQQRPQAEHGRRDILLTLLDLGEMKPDTAPADQEAGSDVVRGLREQLRQAERHIDSVREDYYLTNEDLRAANEELQSLNEEYRSTTEELETSKEELQSINEELQTVNHELKMKVDEISRAHNDLSNLMAATDVAILFLSTDLRIKRFTPQLSTLFNIRNQDYDRPIGDFTHTLDYRTLESDARAVLATATSIERTTTNSAGRTFIVRLTPYRISSGSEHDGVVLTFIDVTAVKEVERALRDSERRLAEELDIMRRLHAVTMAVATAATPDQALSDLLRSVVDLQSADFGQVQLLDPDSGRLRVAVQQGFDGDQFDHVEDIDRRETSACARALRTLTAVEVTDVMSEPGYAPMRDSVARAGYRAVQCTPLRSREGELVGLVSVYFQAPHVFSERDRQLGSLIGQQAADLIVRHAQQDQLRRLNDALRERTTALEASQEELLNQDSNREHFVASLSHELRNPLSAILSSLALIQVTDARSTRALAILRRQTLHMSRLIDDLLDITRVKHGKIRLARQTLELTDWIPQLLESLRQQVEAKGLRLEYDLPPAPVTLEADPQRLAQILQNLVRNAVTFTEAGSVAVTVREDAAATRISVRDTGVGIDPKDAADLFAAYRQADGNAEHSGGLGLGLAVVKALVEAHGGTVGVRSEGRGAGSEFTVTFPRSASVPGAEPVDQHTPLDSRRILVVDDQHDVANSLAAQLEDLGQEVEVAYNAADGLSKARLRKPQVAFVDLSMPETSGTQLARQLRNEFSDEALTLIAMTGHGAAYAAARTDAFDHTLLKPITTEKLRHVLNGQSHERQEH